MLRRWEGHGGAVCVCVNVSMRGKDGKVELRRGAPIDDARLPLALCIDREVAQGAQLLLLEPFFHALGVEGVKARQRPHTLAHCHVL